MKLYGILGVQLCFRRFPIDLAVSGGEINRS